MLFSIHFSLIWKKSLFYSFLLTTLVGCAISIHDNYPAQPDQVWRHRRQFDQWRHYEGSNYYDQTTPEDIWIEQRIYDAEKRAIEAERRAREAEKRALEAEIRAREAEQRNNL